MNKKIIGILIFVSSVFLLSAKPKKKDCYSLGLDAFDAYEYEEAVINLEVALEAENLSSEDMMIAYETLGRSYDALGDYTIALTNYQKAMELTKKISGEDSIDMARCFNLIGGIYYVWGDFESAKNWYEKAQNIAIKHEKGINSDLASIYNNLGNVAYNENNDKEALDLYNKAINIWKKTDGEKSETIAIAYSNLAGFYLDKNDTKTALSYAQKALKLQQEILGEFNADTAYSYGMLAQVYDQMNDLEKAVENYVFALEIQKALFGEYHPDLAETYYNLGLLLYDVKDYKTSAKYLTKAFEIYAVSENYEQIINRAWSIFTEITNIPEKYKIDFYGVKMLALSVGIEAVENARTSLSDKKDEIIAKSLPLYYAGIDMYANVDEKQVFYYSELLRSRGFLEEIGTEAALKLNGITDKERELFKQYSSEIQQLVKKIANENSKGKDKRDDSAAKKYTGELETARKNLADLDESIGKRIPKYNQLRNPQPVSFDEAKKWCGKNRVILEYVLWDESYADSLNKKTGGEKSAKSSKSEIGSYCLVVTNKKVVSVKLDSAYDFNGAVQKFRTLLTDRKDFSDKEMDLMRKELFNQLILPALPYLPMSPDNVTIVADGNLSFIPFNILCTEDGIDFGDAFNLTFSPSVSVSMLTDVTAKAKSGKVLAVGNAVYNKNTADGEDRGFIQKKFLKAENKPTQEELIKQYAQPETAGKYYQARNISWSNIPGTGVEIHNLDNKVFGGENIKLIEGKDAAEEKIKTLSDSKELADYSVIHFACHGYFDTLNPQMSSIVFSEVSQDLDKRVQDGYMTLSEASLLNINANLVNLSACQTGLAQIQKGEGMTGLARSFLVAGAGKVGVTLWSVDDEATCEFMTKMYSRVQEYGMSYQQAYAETKMEFKESDKWNAPYYWAAFVLYE